MINFFHISIGIIVNSCHNFTEKLPKGRSFSYRKHLTR